MKKILILFMALLTLTLTGCQKEDHVKVYFFRSATCTHCESSIEYINSHKGEIPKEIEIITYEVSTASNNELHNALVEKLNVEEEYKDSVPFIVISDEYQVGMDGNATDFNNLITKAKKYIDNDDYKDTVAETIKELQKETGNIKFQGSTLYKDNTIATNIVLGVFGIIIIGFIGLIVFSRKN